DGPSLALVVGEHEARGAVEPRELGALGDVATAAPRGGEDVRREILRLLDADAAREVAEDGGRVLGEDLLEPRVRWRVGHHWLPRSRAPWAHALAEGARPLEGSRSRLAPILHRPTPEPRAVSGAWPARAPSTRCRRPGRASRSRSRRAPLRPR